jgi:hypothetical protein
MSNDKRRRGRPRGSGKNDAPYLMQVADLMIRDPSLKPTTAMKHTMMRQVWPETAETLIRRWQVKWKDQGQAFLDAARDRAKPRRTLRELIAAIGKGQLAELERLQILQVSRSMAVAMKAFQMPPGFAETMKALKMFELPPGLLDAVKAFQMPPGLADAMKGMERFHFQISKEVSDAIVNLKQIRIVPPSYNF